VHTTSIVRYSTATPPAVLCFGTVTEAVKHPIAAARQSCPNFTRHDASAPHPGLLPVPVVERARAEAWHRVLRPLPPAARD
jgi:hypothetical protein